MAKPLHCQRCGRENDPGFAFCLDCGQPLRPPAAAGEACLSCGAALHPGFRFCGICGRPVGVPPPPGRTPPRPVSGAQAAQPAPPSPPSPPPGASARPAPVEGPPVRRLRVTTVRSDGMAGTSFSLDRDEVLCGRSEGAIRLADDPTVSPRHARFLQAGGVLHVEDLGSVNGTFLRVREPRRLALGEEFRVGRQLLRLEPLPGPPAPDERGVLPWGTADPGYRLRLSQLLEGGGLGEVFPLKDGENLVGREAGDVTFPTDRYVSARHARIDVRGAEVTLTDVGSSNGTYARISGAVELQPGDQLLVGGQLLRVDG